MKSQKLYNIFMIRVTYQSIHKAFNSAAYFSPFPTNKKPLYCIQIVPSDGGRCTHIKFRHFIWSSHRSPSFGAITQGTQRVYAMTIRENISLAQYTTFKIGGKARFFCRVRSEDDLLYAINFAKANNLPIFILGGGSNILISDKGFAGLVIRMKIGGINFKDIGRTVVASAGAGEMWDDLVERSVAKGLYGLENLSAIPGTVGAAPVQNIGAYGAEISQTLRCVRVFDTKKNIFEELSHAECQFSYRDSVFKHQKGRYIITRVDFELLKEGEVNIDYKDLKVYFESKGMVNPSLLDVRNAVIEIRWNKLPDWKLWGTAGSFFKNPVVSSEHYERLKKEYPDLPSFPEIDDRFKLPLGWILDRICDVKGLCIGNVCTYEKQALVLVTKPGATSEEVVALAHELMERVKEKTGIEIEGEVEWVN